MAVLYLVIRLTLGMICLWAGISKTRDLRAFMVGVGKYRLIPARIVGPVAIVVIGFEVAVGVLLLIGAAAVFAFAGAVGLFALFSIALAISLARRIDIDCHCFGVSDQEPVSWMALGRAIALVTASAAGLALTVAGQIGPPVAAYAPAVLISAGAATVLRSVTLIPGTWQIFRAPTPAIRPTSTRRVSFKYQELDVSLMSPSLGDGSQVTGGLDNG